MEEAIELIALQIPTSVLQTLSISLENFLRFSQDHNNESDQLEVSNLCTSMREELEALNYKLGEAEENNEAFKYKIIEKDATQLLENLKSQKIYNDYYQKRTNNDSLKGLEEGNEEVHLHMEMEEMGK